MSSRTTILFAAMTLTLLCFSAASAQTPTPTPTPRPRPVRHPVRPTGDTGTSTGTSNSSTTNQTPTENTLVCRMGGNMVWTLVSQFELAQTQINGQNVRVPVVVSLFDQLKFARNGSPAAPDGSNLQPGYCGFTNRAISSSDPDTVVADADEFTINETVLWGNGSTVKGETTMSGGSLSFQNKQAFTMQVALWNGVQWKVVPGTKPKALN